MQKAASDLPLWIESLNYLTGFLITMLTLGMMTLVTSGIGKLFIRQAAAKPASAAEPQATDQAVVPEGLDAPLVAAIAAAVHEAVEEPHKIVSIQPTISGWSQEGRRQIFGGRQVR